MNQLMDEYGPSSGEEEMPISSDEDEIAGDNKFK